MVLRGKKVEKNQKNHEKIENFQLFKIDRNVKIWSNGGQFGPENQLFCKIFTFLAWAWPLKICPEVQNEYLVSVQLLNGTELRPYRIFIFSTSHEAVHRPTVPPPSIFGCPDCIRPLEYVRRFKMSFWFQSNSSMAPSYDHIEFSFLHMPSQGRHRPEVEHQRDRASILILSEKNSLTKLKCNSIIDKGGMSILGSTRGACQS